MNLLPPLSICLQLIYPVRKIIAMELGRSDFNPIRQQQLFWGPLYFQSLNKKYSFNLRAYHQQIVETSNNVMYMGWGVQAHRRDDRSIDQWNAENIHGYNFYEWMALAPSIP